MRVNLVIISVVQCPSINKDQRCEILDSEVFRSLKKTARRIVKIPAGCDRQRSIEANRLSGGYLLLLLAFAAARAAAFLRTT